MTGSVASRPDTPENKERSGPRISRLREAGFSYVEVLLATLITAIALVPAVEGLSVGTRGARLHVEMAEEHFHGVSLLEEILAQPFDALDVEAVLVASPTVATAFSDAPGSPRRRLVYLARYDGDDADGDGLPFTGGDDGLLWVKVEIENSNHVLETLTTR